MHIIILSFYEVLITSKSLGNNLIKLQGEINPQLKLEISTLLHEPVDS